ncbi:MAG: hypothetical protein CFE29_04715 [Bradyrhizobiaceae bacterium PARB1]|jgi:hypothetical protein|nr:MAG: hypothetical protein CFE29_04715 [Bradyrhizobiaceae bacterium PARB1]
MPHAYIIEIANRTAGIVVAEERGFRFFSSETDFNSLEGTRFGSARAVERAVRALLDNSRTGSRRLRAA